MRRCARKSPRYFFLLGVDNLQIRVDSHFNPEWHQAARTFSRKSWTRIASEKSDCAQVQNRLGRDRRAETKAHLQQCSCTNYIRSLLPVLKRAKADHAAAIYRSA